MFYFQPYLGEVIQTWLYNIFRFGWNHQLPRFLMNKTLSIQQAPHVLLRWQIFRSNTNLRNWTRPSLLLIFFNVKNGGEMITPCFFQKKLKLKWSMLCFSIQCLIPKTVDVSVWLHRCTTLRNWHSKRQTPTIPKTNGSPLKIDWGPQKETIVSQIYHFWGALACSQFLVESSFETNLSP